MGDLEGTSGRYWLAVLLITLSSFGFGFQVSIMNEMMSDDTADKGRLELDMKLESTTQSALTSATIVGAAIASFLDAVPTAIGYKTTMLFVGNPLFIIGTALSMIADFTPMFIGRFISGLAVGIAGITAPVLLSEISTENVRGIAGSFHQLLITIGILVAGTAGYGFVTFVDHGWRWLFAVGFLLPAIQLVIGPFLIPESPRWILGRHGVKGYDSAQNALELIRPVDFNVQGELDTMMDKTRRDEDERERGTNRASWAEVFSAQARWPMLIGVGIMLFQPMTGINSVIFYSTTVFQYAGIDQAILATVSVDLVNVLTTVVVTRVIDWFSRKKILITGSVQMLVGLLTLSLSLLLIKNESVEGPVAIAGVLIFICGFAYSWGAVAWPVMTEVTPTPIRSKAVAVFMLINWIMNGLISAFSLPVIDALGKAVDPQGSKDKQQKNGVATLYLIFAAFVFVGIFFVAFVIPNTTGMSLEAIEAMMRGESYDRRATLDSGYADGHGAAPLLLSVEEDVGTVSNYGVAQMADGAALNTGGSQGPYSRRSVDGDADFY